MDNVILFRKPIAEYRACLDEDGNEVPEYFVDAKGVVVSFKSGFCYAMKPSLTSKGYHRVTLYEREEVAGQWRKRRWLIHSLVARAWLGMPEDPNLQINHKDCNKTNNDVSNLEWCTSKANHEHSVLNGLSNKGSRSGRTHLTEDDVVAIRQAYSNGWLQLDLADAYGISDSTVGAIVRYENWKHVA